MHREAQTDLGQVECLEVDHIRPGLEERSLVDRHSQQRMVVDVEEGQQGLVEGRQALEVRVAAGAEMDSHYQNLLGMVG